MVIEIDIYGATDKRYPKKSDIVDNLTTDDSTKVLSAKQGKALKDTIDNLDLDDISSYTGDESTITISEDVISVKSNVFADKVHSHSESDISNLGDYIEKSNTSGLVKNDGTIDTTEYIEEEDFGIQIDEDGILTVVPLSDANVYSGDLYATKTYVDTHIPSVPSASSTTPSADTLNGDVGNGVTWARSNHKHPKSDLYAEANHNHNVNELDNVSTVTVTVTYTDDTTETIQLLKYTPPSS